MCLPEIASLSEVSFVEIPIKATLGTAPMQTVQIAVINSGSLTLELSNDISKSLKRPHTLEMNNSVILCYNRLNPLVNATQTIWTQLNLFNASSDTEKLSELIKPEILNPPKQFYKKSLL